MNCIVVLCHLKDVFKKEKRNILKLRRKSCIGQEKSILKKTIEGKNVKEDDEKILIQKVGETDCQTDGKTAIQIS